MKPGDMELGSVRSVSAFHRCWTISQLWDTPPAAEALHLLWKIIAPPPGWWGKMVPVARLRGAWHVACTPHRKGQPYESRLCAPSIQRARGARKALNENVSSQQMNGKSSRFSFFTDSMLFIKFTYLLIFICDPKIHRHGASAVICRYVQSSENSELPNARVPSGRWTRGCSAFSSQLSYVHRCAVFCISWCQVFLIFAVCLVILLFSMIPKLSAASCS